MSKSFSCTCTGDVKFEFCYPESDTDAKNPSGKVVITKPTKKKKGSDEIRIEFRAKVKDFEDIRDQLIQCMGGGTVQATPPAQSPLTERERFEMETRAAYRPPPPALRDIGPVTGPDSAKPNDEPSDPPELMKARANFEGGSGNPTIDGITEMIVGPGPRT